jgi:hypothetical protein
MNLQTTEEQKNKLLAKLIELTKCNKIRWYHPWTELDNYKTITHENEYKLDEDHCKRFLNIKVSMYKGWFSYTLTMEDRVFKEKRKRPGAIHYLWNYIDKVKERETIEAEARHESFVNDKIKTLMELKCDENS